MKTTSMSKGSTPENYVRELRLRSPVSSQVYLSILNGFQRFVAEQAEDKSVSQTTIRQWLKDRILAWPFHIVTDRARLVDRFLDWRVNNRALANNPFADLRAEYGQRTTTPVVRALVNPNPEAALEALRPLPRFGSFLGPVMREHVGLMHAMGYRYNTQAERLLRLDRFLQGRPELSGHPLTELIREWTNTRSTPQHALDCHQAGRVLSSVLSRIDPTVEKIPSDKRIWRLAKERYRQPYIFSEQDVLGLLETALSFPSPQSPLRPKTLHMMLVLAYCAGLRIGEVVRLNVGDFNIDDRVIEVHDTKFFKSRRLPLSDSAVAALQSYLTSRKGAGASMSPDCSGINMRAADTRATGPESCWSVFYGGRSSNLLRDAWVRVCTIFVMPSSQAACSPGTARVSILSRASRTWPHISGTKISTRRWCTSPLPRICFSKPASDFACGAPGSCSL
jgi:integrase/recombinase XerD